MDNAKKINKSGVLSNGIRYHSVSREVASCETNSNLGNRLIVKLYFILGIKFTP